ncbi:MAG: hypothetical protein LBV27_00470 [Oscillospiraceae bacterium]|nr:hypothetical protein [Oscillospiraceae bacterium]
MSPALRWALLAGLGISLIFGVTQVVLTFGTYGIVPTLLSGLAIFSSLFIVSVLFTLLVAALKRLRWQTALVFFFSLPLCLLSMALGVYLAPLLVSVMATAYLAVMCAKGQYKALGRWKRILRYCLLGLFGALAASTLVLILWPGPSLSGRPERATLALPFAENLQPVASSLGDPSVPGSYSYSTQYYATAGQKLDPYPGQTAIPSRTVDASELVEGWSDIRKSRLGFEADALPLNGQVWMPEGEAPFPLTLIVHGNHESGDRSDSGYAYLGELLASRGIIAVSVDENFLNSSILYDALLLAGLQDENDARAFVLLEHLRQWYDWNADAASSFYGKVDFDNVALIGHSRGGEAVALAAAFAGLFVSPDNGGVRFDYPFQIKSVVAIAPVHRQHDPAGLEAELKGVNYMVLHGGNDMDVSNFSGANMYRRADVSDSGIKAQVWMQYANHGQFNGTWGANDTPGLMNFAYNRRLLMPEEEQQQAAKVFIGAFLESTLHGKEEYNALFRDFAQGGEWLPPARYITDYVDSETVMLDSYDGGYDLTASTSGVAAYSAQGFDGWTQAVLPGKWENSNRVLTLTWGSEEYAEKHGPQTPVFTTEFTAGVLAAGDKLYVSLCSGKEGAEKPDVSFKIRLTDSAGNTAERSVNDFGGVVNPLESPIGKPVVSSLVGDREPVLQMVCIPTEQFEGLAGDIVRMEWVLDPVEVSKDGQTMYVDDLRVATSTI